jgi:hypothetical protein
MRARCASKHKLVHCLQGLCDISLTILCNSQHLNWQVLRIDFWRAAPPRTARNDSLQLLGPYESARGWKAEPGTGRANAGVNWRAVQ